MAPRVVGHGADNFETVSLVETRSLECVRVERDLLTTVATRLGFGRGEQPRAHAALPHVLTYPERLDPTGSAPAPTMDSRDQLPVGITFDEQELARVRDAGYLDVERDDLIQQTLGESALLVIHGSPGSGPRRRAAGSAIGSMISEDGSTSRAAIVIVRSSWRRTATQ